MTNSSHGIQLIAAPFTPFHPDGTLHAAVIERQAQGLVEAGVDGAFVCGTTGEGASLTVAERMTVAERWAAMRPAELRLFVHVGHSSLAEAKTLAAHAQQVRADAVAAIGPFYFKPSTATELVAFCQELAAAAPTVPFFYYHMPAMSGVNIRMSEFLPVAAAHIPNFAGIKFTHEDLLDYSECLTFAGDRYEILFGRDEVLLAGLALGARGAVGSTYNFAAAIYRRLIAAFAAGNIMAARAEQTAAREMIMIMGRHGGLPAGKVIMKLCGIDCGPVRSPLKTLSADEENTLRGALAQIGFLAKIRG